MASTMGQHNQLRYRGYVYDPETNLYFLNSRFYNPETGRFINADVYPSTGQGLTGNNMCAYCGNNPVIRTDDGGDFWNIIIGAVVGAVVSEWLGGFEGLGVYMTRVKKAYAFDKMFAVIILVSLVSLALMGVVALLKNIAMPYKRKK